jgi:Protein of unknown function (DUF2911)
MKIAVGCAVLVVCAAASVSAQSDVERGGFLTRLGNDTIAVERFVRTRDSISGEMIGRSPTTRRYAYVARLGPDGMVTTYSATVFETGAANAPARVRIDADLRGDSIYVKTTRGGTTQASAVGLARAVPLLEPAYGLHAILVSRAIAAAGKSVRFSWWFVGDGPDTGTVVRAKPGLVLIRTPTDTIRIETDATGQIMYATDPGGTLQATVQRIPYAVANLDQWATVFAARDAKGKSLGVLSPRDTARATVAGTHVLVDYGRPSRRGRTVFGGVVPYNTVWRTGANAATTLVVDHDVMLGDTKVPAGEYTLFSISTPDAWTLIVNKKTKEWGTEYDSTADFAHIPLSTGSGQPVEMFTITVDPTGEMALAWDTRVGRVSIRPAGSR